MRPAGQTNQHTRACRARVATHGQTHNYGVGRPLTSRYVQMRKKIDKGASDTLISQAEQLISEMDIHPDGYIWVPEDSDGDSHVRYVVRNVGDIEVYTSIPDRFDVIDVHITDTSAGGSLYVGIGRPEE